MLVHRISDPDYQPAYPLQMLPVTHLKNLIYEFTTCVILSCHSTETKRARLSILVYIENGVFYLMSCRKSNISPKYKSGTNEAEKEANYF